jgi:alkanesulfonate monooxygenase SsuD/methylene tetrahydromethanopterin reductase-like flavin-dependent oxidoreductase (luciferase family)
MMEAVLPLSNRIRFGAGIAAGNRDAAIEAINSLAAWGYDIISMPDHVAFTGPVSDPLAQLTYFAALQPNLIYETGVYLLPLRHPVTVAKVVASVDRLMGAGHFIFGIGVGGEFPAEYEACGIPVTERGGRTNESIDIIRRLWTGEPVEHRGKYFSFGKITMLPKPATPGGPPIWIGGRSDAALRRAARLGDGWIPYVISADRFASGLEFIAREAELAHRAFTSFGTGVQIFATIADSYEKGIDVASERLSKRYAMNFREATKRYAAVGRPADIAEQIGAYIKAGARDIGVDLVCRRSERNAQLEQFAKEVIPLLRS